MIEEICFSDATGLAGRIRAGELSPVEVTTAFLDRMEAVDPGIHALVTMADGALEQAREAEEAAVRGELRGPLHGVPFTAKDCFDTAGVRTTRGSLIYARLVPETDAAAVSRLKAAGGILLGKTNLPEFALRAETANRLFARTLHPMDPGRTCGGSSGGEAAAVSSGMSPLGIGTDLGGSNRLPSHYCGNVGFKPTHGRIPLTGSWPELTCRHMHVGPLCRSVRDAALALSVLSGPDGKDPYATADPFRLEEEVEGGIAGLRVGMFSEGPFAPVEKEICAAVSQAASALEGAGCVVEEVDFDWSGRMPIDVCMIMVRAELGRCLDPFIAGREKELSEPIRGLLDLPPPSLEEFLESMDNRDLLARDMADFFSRHDLLLCPTAPVTAHGHEAETLLVDGVEAGPGHAANITATFGLVGCPAMSVPFAKSGEGLPVGVQVAARHFDEATLFRAASVLESAGGQGRGD